MLHQLLILGEAVKWLGRISPPTFLSYPMRLVALFALLLSGTAAAQTCAGVLDIAFYDVDYEGREAGRYLIPIQSLDVTAAFFYAHEGYDASKPLRTADEARGDPTLVLRAEERFRSESQLVVPGTLLRVAPRCDLALLHLVLTYRHGTMTLDVYHVPNHLPLRLDGPLPFRPGRFVLDLGDAELARDDSSAYRVIPARLVVPAGEE